MGNVRAQILTQEIDTRLNAGRAISEEMYRRLFDILSEMVVNGTDGDGAFDLLLHDVRAAYRYNEASKREGFDIGACWAALSLMDACASHAEKQSFWRDCVAKVQRHREIFETLEHKPGAKQRDIAQALGCGTSNVSQRLAGLEPYRLFVVSVEGKSKQYYLTPKGKRALDEVRLRAGTEAVPTDTLQLRAAFLQNVNTGSIQGYTFDCGPVYTVPRSDDGNENLGRIGSLPERPGRLAGAKAVDSVASNTFSRSHREYAR